MGRIYGIFTKGNTISFHHYSWCTTKFFNELQNIQDPKWPNTIPKNGNDLHSSHELLIYDPISKTFRIIKTGGDVPPRTLAPSGRVDQTYFISAKSLKFNNIVHSTMEPPPPNMIMEMDIYGHFWMNNLLWNDQFKIGKHDILTFGTFVTSLIHPNQELTSITIFTFLVDNTVMKTKKIL